VREEVVEVFERVVGEHGSALQTLDGQKGAGCCGTAFEGDEPLEDRQET
jgi:hypothetical protein